MKFIPKRKGWSQQNDLFSLLVFVILVILFFVFSGNF